jgi:hypothetical protein
MSRSELPAGSPERHGGRHGRRGVSRQGGGYGRYVGLFAVLILVLITINTVVTKPNGVTGIEPGHQLPPFAVPLVMGTLAGAADTATRANEGARGRVPACAERGPRILNICQLYEGAPVVLALFIDSGSCEAILGDLQRLAPSFPGVRFAGVSIRGDRAALRRLVRSRALSLPVGIDSEGALAALYKDASCPQVTFAYPGGLAQGKALLRRPSFASLRARVAELASASRARGWKGGSG